MRPYEIMVILDSSLEDDAIRAVIDRATAVLTGQGASVGRVDRWGRRRFAYEVNHRSEGYYALIEATAEPAAMAMLDRSLGLADEVVRHKVIRLPDKVAGRAPRRSAGDPAAAAAPNANGA